MIETNRSFIMKPAAKARVSPCEGGEMSKEQQDVVDRYRKQQAAIDRYRAKSKSVQKCLSAQQRKALVEKCPIAQRDDTVR